ncbi:hypothetical protein AN958_04785 [Leucoagaricus sp. SymC.cos]|nr:hypothetical protein AN958_04785 [Leucoagaricus sp. SymC.cos]
MWLLSRRTWSLEPENSRFGPNSRWSNKDMDPVPPHARTWTTWNYVAYWISDAANVSVWQMASSMIAVGLSWREALSAIAVGHIIIAVIVVLNGTIGAHLHVAFPVITRVSFGFWLSYFAVISRVVLAMFWFGILTFIGSECLYQMLKAIWPSIARVPNHLPESSNITTVGIVHHVLLLVLADPISPHVRISSENPAPLHRKIDSGSGSLAGNFNMGLRSAYSWAWLSALNSALGIYATLSVNIPDFTRYAKNARAQYIQLAIIPTVFTFVSFVGIAVTSAGEKIYGEILWDPLRLIDKWDNRAAAFFASFSFMLATLGTNISANTISAANDMTALLPQYLNIKRGQVICAILGGLALCPWEILASAPRFLSFMSGYTVFLGPFAAMDFYWLIRRCKVDVPAMYEPNGRYRYWNGINWRALVTLIVSITPNLPGLIHNINPNIFVGNASFMFNVSWLSGFFVAGAVYWILSIAFKPADTFVGQTIHGDDLDNGTVVAVGESLSVKSIDGKIALET